MAFGPGWKLKDIHPQHREKAARLLSRALGAGNGPTVQVVAESPFLSLWRRLGGPELTPEHRFHPVRRWRFDWANLDLKIAFELDGGVWQNGRHNRGKGFLNDLEKMNHAQILGWKVFRLGTGMVTEGHVLPIVESLKKLR